jgi:hypothetical protein
VTPAGRNAAKIRHREGIAHGAGAGDLNESTYHVAMVELGRRYLEQAFVEDPESRVVDVIPYHEPGSDPDSGRLDVAGLDGDGEVVVALEAERSNNDMARAVPSDYDTMAGTDPEEAIWIAETRADAHDILTALNDPAEGPARVKKTYSEGTAPQKFTIDTPGLTEMYTFTHLRNVVSE